MSKRSTSSEATTPGQSGPGSNSNEEVLVVEVLLQRCIRCILQLQMPGLIYKKRVREIMQIKYRKNITFRGAGKKMAESYIKDYNAEGEAAAAAAAAAIAATATNSINTAVS